MDTFDAEQVVPLSSDRPIWDQVFTIAPLVIIGSRDLDGSYNLAPKHLATPLSWTDHCFSFPFVKDFSR